MILSTRTALTTSPPRRSPAAAPSARERVSSSSTLDVPDDNDTPRAVRRSPADMNIDGRFHDNRKSPGGAAAMHLHSGVDANPAGAACQALPPAQGPRFGTPWSAEPTAARSSTTDLTLE